MFCVNVALFDESPTLAAVIVSVTEPLAAVVETSEIVMGSGELLGSGAVVAIVVDGTDEPWYLARSTATCISFATVCSSVCVTGSGPKRCAAAISAAPIEPTTTAMIAQEMTTSMRLSPRSPARTSRRVP